jgi:hypothetical protein
VQWPLPIRRALRRADPGPNRLRWFPDFIVAKGDAVFLIDAKTTVSDTPNWSIQRDAWICHAALEASINATVVYVFPNWTANFHQQVRVHTWFDGRGTRGSGTPFGLMLKSEQAPFDIVFGPPRVDEDHGRGVVSSHTRGFGGV